MKIITDKLPEKRRTYQRKIIKGKPIRPWRLCPAGHHYRKGASVAAYVTSSGKKVSAHKRGETCAKNSSGKDQLYPEEIQGIAEKYFVQFRSRPIGTLPEFAEVGNRYDHLIHGWAQYWNDLLKPSEPLDPAIVKALIASESSFNPAAWNKQRGPGRARGLTQVTDATLRYLKDNENELKDHFLNLTEDDMLDPNLSICAGIRWLFRKRELARIRLKREASWREVVAAFKGVTPRIDTKQSKRVMAKFDQYLSELTEK